MRTIIALQAKITKLEKTIVDLKASTKQIILDETKKTKEILRLRDVVADMEYRLKSTKREL